MNIADCLGRWARETPFAVAIVERTRIVPYRDLDAAVWHAASWLVAAGVRPGDRVGISLAGNSARYLIVVYALARMGAVTMLLPVAEPPAVRLALARRFRLAAVVADDDATGLGTLPLLKPPSGWPGRNAAPADAGLRAAGGAAPWMICLSSGTTGAPKAMERRHEDHIRLCDIGHLQAGNAPSDRSTARTSPAWRRPLP
jgi:non-ribosomal peptide synthetase component E (peptide arylation enzyme)